MFYVKLVITCLSLIFIVYIVNSVYKPESSLFKFDLRSNSNSEGKKDKKKEYEIIEDKIKTGETKENDLNSLYPDLDNSIACNLSYLAFAELDTKEKLKVSIKKEEAKVLTIFDDLKTNHPKMITPAKTELIKVKEESGVYWLTSPFAFGITMYTIDMNKKILIMQKSVSFMGLYGYSWIGRCK